MQKVHRTQQYPQVSVLCRSSQPLSEPATLPANQNQRVDAALLLSLLTDGKAQEHAHSCHQLTLQRSIIKA